MKAFNDPVTGKSFAKQFLEQNKDVDVLFQVAGKTGNGVLQAACDADIFGIGVDVDQSLSLSATTAKCTVTSAEKNLSKSVGSVIAAIAAGTAKGGDVLWNAARDGIGYSPAHDTSAVVPADSQPQARRGLRGHEGRHRSRPARTTAETCDPADVDRFVTGAVEEPLTA